MALNARDRDDTLTSALAQIKQGQQELASLRAQFDQVRQTLLALWDLLKTRTGLTDEDLRNELRGVLARRESARAARCCPKCSRPLQDVVRHCIYCGEVVERNDLF